MAKRRLLPEELTIYTAGELREQFQAWARRARRGTTRVDGSDVLHVDAAGLQLLLALRGALARKDAVLQIEHPADALVGAAQTMGVGAALGIATAGGLQE